MVLFAILWSQSSPMPQHPEHCLGPYPELNLSMNRTHPYETGPVDFASSTDSIHPHAIINPSSLGSCPELFSNQISRTHSYCKSHKCFTTLLGSFNVAMPKALL